MGTAEFRLAGGAGVVTMPAEIDVSNAGEIRQALRAALSHDIAVLVIDMSETTFCDSAGVHVIIAAYRRAAATGIGLRLAATTVLRVFTLVGVDQLIPMYPTLEAALAAQA